MKVRNIRVSHQMSTGFAIILLIIIVLGVFSSYQLGTIHSQTEVMYNHPLQVRRAISTLELELTNINLGMRDLINQPEKYMDAKMIIESSKAEIENQMGILDEFYLGPIEDVENIKESYYQWVSIQDQVIRMVEDEKFDIALELIDVNGPALLNVLLKNVNVVDQYARDKADTLYQNSAEIYQKSIYQFIVIIIVIIALALFVLYILVANIRGPLNELIEVANAFGEGDKDVRVGFNGGSEFGELAKAMNDMMDKVQANVRIGENKAELAKNMLIHDDIEPFFREMLTTLMTFVGGQMASAYLIKKNRRAFDFVSSVGMPVDHDSSFTFEQYTGEFGLAVASGKWQIADIENHRAVYNYQTTAGEYSAKSILTIPLFSGKNVIGVISIATVNTFNPFTEELVDAVMDTINARVESIMTLKAIKEVTEKLEVQNSELDIQRMELSTQTEALTKQNIELEIQKEKLNEANQLKTNFLSNMSHELRTPLNSVIALTGVLKRKLDGDIPDKEHSYLEVIERNGKHLLALINDILDISRIESGYEEINVTRFDINELIEEVVEMIQPQLHESEIEMKHMTSNEELYIESDDNKLKHILQNLLSNAIKFTEVGSVKIGANRRAHGIEISVLDTGVGIAEEHISHIFDEFRQADGSTSRKFGGTGLGLAIVKKYTNLLGGEIEVSSNLDEGSEFTISLPLRIEAKKSISKEKPVKTIREKVVEKPATNQEKKTILVVEDSTAAVIQIRELFEADGYNVLAAHNGHKAEQLLENVTPDAIILDLMMPIVDGFDVIRNIRSNERLKDLPILILTAKQITVEDSRFFEDNAIYQLIQKGDVDEAELKSAVESMIYPELYIEKEIPRAKVVTRESRTLDRSNEQKLKVLVVEDNKDNIITVRALLADDYDVYEAEDGVSGVLMAQNIYPDLVLMDIALPEMDGIEAFKRITKIEGLEDVPVIALTASVMIDEKESILAHGFDGFIGKPILQEKFYSVIDEVLYGSS